MKIAVVTDSGTGLTKQEAQDKGIHYLPLQIILKDTMFLDGEDISVHELYERLKNGEMSTTSMPPMGRIEALFEDLKSEGYDAVIAIPLTSGLSSTASVMQAAAQRHELQLHVIECFTTCHIQCYLALHAIQMVHNGVALEEIVARLKDAVAHSNTLIIPDDLQHLKRGGRLTPLAAALGGLLKIKPILKLNQESQGKIDVYDKVRTMSKAMAKGVSTFQEQGLDESYQLIVLHSGSQEAGLKMKELMEEAYPNNDIYFGLIGAVISAHTGLGCVGIQYIKKINVK